MALKTEPKNKSYVFAHMDTNCLDDVKIVLAPDNKACVKKILDKYHLFDDMIEFVLDGADYGGIESMGKKERAQHNETEKSRKEFLEKNQDKFFDWFPCYVKDSEGNGWDYKIVEKLV